jgi:hypothetical protein
LEVTWKEMRVGKLALIVPVMTSTEGRCVAMMTWMPAARAIWARRCTAPFDLLAGHHHQVGHLVDDHDDVGHRLEIELLGLEDRLAGLVVEAGLHGRVSCSPSWRRHGDALVEAVDVAHAELRHLLVAVLHLADRPFQRHTAFLRVGDDRRQRCGMPS